MTVEAELVELEWELELGLEPSNSKLLTRISSRTKENETVLSCATQGRAIAKLRQAIALDLASSRLNNQSFGESFLSNNNLILDNQPNERPKIQKAKTLH